MFVSVDTEVAAEITPLMSFAEDEGVTLILPTEEAHALDIDYDFVAAWITLTVHSALEAVGLTAAFSAALTDAGISCNVVAATFHDHLFAPAGDAERGLAVLADLSSAARSTSP